MSVPGATDDDSTAPLTGLLVADFSRVLAGPLATMWLADLGATVVKVERAGVGDETRTWGPPWAGDTSSYFTAANRSKLSITLDFTDEADLGVAHDLAAKADVLVENFRTGVLAKLGLDHASLSQVNPGLVYASITGFGSGAGAELAGYDFVVQAVGGLMSVTGDPQGDPHKVGVALVDVLTAKDVLIGVLAALRARDQHGRGQHVEVSLLSSLLASMANQTSSLLATGESPGRMGNKHPSIAPYETLRCDSSLLAVACGNDGQFRRLTEALGVPEVADDARFADNAARVAHREEMVAILEGRLSARSAADWEELLTGVSVPAGQVGTVADGVARGEALGLRPTVEVAGDTPAQMRHPVDYSHLSVRPPTAPPTLGAHDRVVRDWLASGDDVADLESQASSDRNG